jgi:hypothetical protein
MKKSNALKVVSDNTPNPPAHLITFGKHCVTIRFVEVEDQFVDRGALRGVARDALASAEELLSIVNEQEPSTLTQMAMEGVQLILNVAQALGDEALHNRLRE